MDASPPKSLKILCFGDSLTAGYTMRGAAEYPYAEFLQLYLTRLFPSTAFTVDASGKAGDRVVGPSSRFLSRIGTRFAKAVPEGGPYDWVIILGGTNDLGWFGDPKVIYEGLSTPPQPRLHIYS